MKLPQSVSEIWHEKLTGDGWWATYKPGWCSGMDEIGACHCEHETTKKKLLESIKRAQKCNCPDCCPKSH